VTLIAKDFLKIILWIAGNRKLIHSLVSNKWTTSTVHSHEDMTKTATAFINKGRAKRPLCSFRVFVFFFPILFFGQRNSDFLLPFGIPLSSKT